MRNKHYKVKSFRLSDEVLEYLEKEKKENESWNQLLERLLNIKNENKSNRIVK